MSKKNDKDPYLNFDEYLRQGNPQKKERAEAWQDVKREGIPITIGN